MNQDNRDANQNQQGGLKGHAGQGGQTQFRGSSRKGPGQQSGLTDEHRSFQGPDSSPVEGARNSQDQGGQSMQDGTEGGESVQGRAGVGEANHKRGRDSQAETSNT